jgi:hypothetical protein
MHQHGKNRLSWWHDLVLVIDEDMQKVCLVEGVDEFSWQTHVKGTWLIDLFVDIIVLHDVWLCMPQRRSCPPQRKSQGRLDADPVVAFIIGLSIILLASILNAAGLNLTKLDHVRRQIQLATCLCSMNC